MAKVVRFHELGGPEVLRVEEYDPPSPEADEVLLDIEAIGLNRGEAAMRTGNYIIQPELPGRMGGEAAGRVSQVGANVTDLKVGDRVVMLAPPSYDRYGAYASQTVHPAGSVFRIPDGMDVEAAATSWISFLTAWGGLIAEGKVQKGEQVLITAAASTVGLAALQVVRAAGGIPIATTRSADKVEPLLEAGAEHVVNTRDADIVEEIGKLTDRKGLRLIFDPIAGPFAEKLFECLAPHGTLMLYGGLSKQQSTFPRHVAIRGNLSMRGYNVGMITRDPERLKQVVAQLGPKFLDGTYNMPIAQRFALDDIAKAHEVLEKDAHLGKIVVTV